MDVPKEFPFPFKPYSIQEDFMKDLYQCIEKGKLGIFESPTGTGKSLSLICGSLTWLERHETEKKAQIEREFERLNIEDRSEDQPVNSNEPSWFSEAKKNVASSRRKNELKEELNKILRHEEKINKLKERVKVVKHSLSSTDKYLEKNPEPPKFKDEKKNSSISQEDEDVLIGEVKSDDEDSDIEEPCEEMEEGTKIIFASRTHSQISQFVREVEKSPFGKQIRVCTLASRQQMCINEAVTQLKNNNLVNEKCLEMQRKRGSSATVRSKEGQTLKKSKSTTCSCPYLNPQRVQDIRDVSLTEVVDVENLVQSGKKHKACPYYASRKALSDAQLIVVPYSILLHRSTRKACGLNLRNNVVIIDEAHNLLETISSIHNVLISGSQVSQAHWQLSQYQLKFSTRLSPKNLLHIKQLLFFLSCLLKLLGLSSKERSKEISSTEAAASTVEVEKVFDVVDFSLRAGFDHLNLHKLIEFCEKSKLPQKLVGFRPVAVQANPTRGLKSFLQKLKPEEEILPPEAPVEAMSGSPLMSIVDFMRNLCNPCKDGRILAVKKTLPSKSFFKYLLLNPASLFSDLVTEPRSVIVAGGTMQPLWEFQYQLFGAAGASQDRIMTFACGHVIPPNHVLPIALCRGPSNKPLDFSWANRSNMLDELFNLIFNIIQVVPGGVVCFLPSYDFEQQFTEHLKRQDHISKLERKKKLFREPKKANEVDATLSEYSQCIRLCASRSDLGRNGALLLCVVGGKLSEGINFSDDLARCVIVVGLPYANSKSAELKEKMDFLNQTTMNLRCEGESRLPGQLHYEALCFKAVNQSIGRAIRHQGDYASLILADARYSRPSSKASLPEWIAQRLTVSDKFGSTVASVRKFLLERSQPS